MIPKKKAAIQAAGPSAASKTHNSPHSIGSAIWVLTYRIEEARQRYADRRQLLKQAAACVFLALLRLVGVRHA